MITLNSTTRTADAGSSGTTLRATNGDIVYAVNNLWVHRFVIDGQTTSEK